MIKKLSQLSVVFCFASFAFAQTGTIQGIVKDTNNLPVPMVDVALYGANGYYQYTETNNLGEYAFNNVPYGSYTLKIYPDPQWEIVDPQAKVYSVNLQGQAATNYDWILKDSGVAIDFGKPPEQGSLGDAGRINFYDEFHVNIHGVGTLTANKPAAVVIKGQLLLDADPEAIIKIERMTAMGDYLNATVSYEMLEHNQFLIEIRSAGWPGFAYDGPLALMGITAVSPNRVANPDISVNPLAITFFNEDGTIWLQDSQ